MSEGQWRTTLNDIRGNMRLLKTPRKERSMDPCERLMQFFVFEHLPEHLQFASEECHALATEMLQKIPHNPELTVGLRKLLEAKDCFVRALIYKE